MIYFEYDQTLLKRAAEEKPPEILSVMIVLLLISAIAIWAYCTKQEPAFDAQISIPVTSQSD